MKIDDTEDGDLNLDTLNYKKLLKGIVIFPENLKDIKELKKLKKKLKAKYD